MIVNINTNVHEHTRAYNEKSSSVHFKQINTHTHRGIARLSQTLSECSHLQSVIAFTSTNSVYKGCLSDCESPRCSITQTAAVNILLLLLHSTNVTAVIYKLHKTSGLLHNTLQEGHGARQLFIIEPLVFPEHIRVQKIRKVLDSSKLSAHFCQAINVHSGTQQVQGAVGVPEVNSNVLFRDVLKVCQVNTELRVARILQQHYTYMLWPVFRITNFIHTSFYHQYGGWL